MTNPSVTYTFTNGSAADATQVNQNFTDLINAMTDGTKTFNIDALTCAGAATFNGAVTLGNAAGDAINCTGAFTATAAAVFNGAVTLGDAAADTITVNGTWASGSTKATSTNTTGLLDISAGSTGQLATSTTPGLVNPYAQAGVVYADTTTVSCSAGNNTDSITVTACHYERVGEIVTVSVVGAINITNTGAYDSYITPPIASNFSATTDAAGVGWRDESTSYSLIAISGYAPSDVVKLNGYGTYTGTAGYNVTFQYVIK